MNESYFIKGIFCIIGGLIFLKYFRKPQFTEKDSKKAEEEGNSEQLIYSIKMLNRVRDIKGWIGGIGLLVFGFLLIYMAFKNC